MNGEALNTSFVQKAGRPPLVAPRLLRLVNFKGVMVIEEPSCSRQMAALFPAFGHVAFACGDAEMNTSNTTTGREGKEDTL